MNSEFVDAVYELIKENHSISRAALAKALGTSERQVRKAIDILHNALYSIDLEPDQGEGDY